MSKTIENQVLLKAVRLRAPVVLLTCFVLTNLRPALASYLDSSATDRGSLGRLSAHDPNEPPQGTYHEWDLDKPPWFSASDNHRVCCRYNGSAIHAKVWVNRATEFCITNFSRFITVA